MTPTCQKAVHALRACARFNLVIALEATLSNRPRMAADHRRMARECSRDARLLQTTAAPDPTPEVARVREIVECGSGHPIGICPKCKRGHGYSLDLQSA